MLVVTAAKVSRYLTSYVAMGLHRAASAGAVDTCGHCTFPTIQECDVDDTDKKDR